MEKGKLFVVATPIGNLKDVSFRTLDILKETDFILCEDTRITGRLLSNYKIKNELISFNARTEERKIEFVVKRILNGESAAIVSDSGTPGISDPGVRLVNEIHKNEITVSGIPGPNAAITALSISGLPTDSFVFEGFLPQKKGRQKKLTALSEEERTIILYESVYRIEKLLNELNEFMPERFLFIGRELTKMFEEYWTGIPQDILFLLKDKKIKGEFVVVIAPKNWKSDS